jgi:flagellar hook-associated protein 1 FlgK
VAANGPLDGSIALQLGDMATSNTGADATYNSLIQKLGVDAKDIQTRDNVQQQSVQSLDAARNSQAGVNTDEEMTNMVEYQKAYEASAKFITTLNSMLETLMTMVG